mmetsp:Transcript_22275/g.63913  ORF Transcript_22275/g.63913 Transcript_22275/m.63913 type:complete len:83 (-) Transcript_22275:9-257(-)
MPFSKLHAIRLVQLAVPPNNPISIGPGVLPAEDTSIDPIAARALVSDLSCDDGIVPHASKCSRPFSSQQMPAPYAAQLLLPT